MTLRRELTIPFHGIGEAGRSLGTGSWIILRLLGTSATTGIRMCWHTLTPPAAKAGRGGEKKTQQSKPATPSGADRLEALGIGLLTSCVAVIFVGGTVTALLRVGWSHVAPHSWWLVGGVTVAWVLASWTVAPPTEAEHTPKVDLEKSAEGEQDTPPPAPDPQQIADRMSHTVIQAVADAEDTGFKGVHVAELLTILDAEGLPDLQNVGSLREWLEASHFPVTRNLKLRGKGNTWGVRADALSDTLGMPLRQALHALESRPSDGDPQAPDTTAEEGAPTPSPAPPAGSSGEVPPARHLRAVPDPSSEAAA